MRFIPTVRPYWHVDAKWICGIFLMTTLSACLLLCAATNLTDGHRAPDIAALVIGEGFMRGNAIDINAARKALASHGGVVHPIPNMPQIVITETDLHLTSQQISLKVFRPLTEEIYHDGIPATAAHYTSSSAQQANFIKEATFLRPFTQRTHRELHNLFIVFAIVSVVLAAGVMYFSARWGRLSNLGFLLVIVSLPGTLASMMLLHSPHNGSGGLGSLPSQLTNEVGASLRDAYLKITLLGAALLLAAFVGRVFSFIKSHHANTQTSTKTTKDSKEPQRKIEKL
jgi:amino acid transporter